MSRRSHSAAEVLERRKTMLREGKTASWTVVVEDDEREERGSVRTRGKTPQINPPSTAHQVDPMLFLLVCTVLQDER